VSVLANSDPRKIMARLGTWTTVCIRHAFFVFESWAHYVLTYLLEGELDEDDPRASHPRGVGGEVLASIAGNDVAGWDIPVATHTRP